ncbi:MAG: hypothetical protein ACOVLB_06235 [Candidatus Nanopelagicus sp.]
MKVVIGPYKNWVGPYQIAEKLLFWLDKHKDHRVHEFGRWLSETKTGEDSGLTKLCQWIESKRSRQEYVRIDSYDTWGMDCTLAMIALPMLKQLKATKHGSPCVSDEDVPDELKSTAAPQKEFEHDIDDNHFKRWDWVLDQMIFAFECKVDETWQEQYRSGVHDMQTKPCAWDENGKPTLYEMFTGPKDTYVCDYAAMAVHQARISNGFRLFGKYYEALWD